MPKFLTSKTFVPVGLLFGTVVATVAAVTFVQAPATELRKEIEQVKLTSSRQEERVDGIKTSLARLESELRDQRRENTERWEAVLRALTRLNGGIRESSK